MTLSSAVFKDSSTKKGIETVKAVVDRCCTIRSCCAEFEMKNLMFQAETALNFVVGGQFCEVLLVFRSIFYR